MEPLCHVAIIELARTESRNPEVPEWLRDDYFRSIQELAQMGTKDILFADESETKRAMRTVFGLTGISRSIFRGRVVGNGAMMSEIADFDSYGEKTPPSLGLRGVCSIRRIGARRLKHLERWMARE